MTILNPVTKLAEIPEWFRHTKTGKKIEHETLSQNRQLRDELIAEKKGLLKDREEKMPGLSKECDAKLKANQKAALALRQSEDDLRNATFNLKDAATSFDTSMNRVNSHLLEIADPQIAAAVDAWQDELHRIIQLQPIERKTPTGKFFPQSGKREIDHTSNKEEILSLRAPIQAAIKRLESLQLKNPENVEVAIEEIVSKLNPIGEVDQFYQG